MDCITTIVAGLRSSVVGNNKLKPLINSQSELFFLKLLDLHLSTAQASSSSKWLDTHTSTYVYHTHLYN